MLLCERCQVYRADVQTSWGWLCEACAGLDDEALDLMDGPHDDEEDEEEHDPECPCDECKEAEIELWAKTNGQLP